ncbi:MAG: hypothetical protein PHG13_02105 [Candidatus Pacebacteria bacterium]|nr:hypothetical protein [Candidatus Paceibacterota bacterium]MDD5721773.1 hypothetical protein [Candidatus Paceibacterota bacterium]
MTIIYNSTKNKGRQAMILNSKKRLTRNNKRKWRCFVNDAGQYLGHIKLVFLFAMPIVIISGFWLVLFGQNISADYKIISLKQELNQIEDNINYLNEQSAIIVSREKVTEWAELNNFVKAQAISYLDMGNKNLAQR